MGVFGFISTLSGFHWRLRPSMLEGVRERAARLALPARYLGVHLRRGDACGNHGSDRIKVSNIYILMARRPHFWFESPALSKC